MISYINLSIFFLLSNIPLRNNFFNSATLPAFVVEGNVVGVVYASCVTYVVVLVDFVVVVSSVVAANSVVVGGSVVV